MNQTGKKRYPIEIREYDYGWVITYFDQNGRVKHVISAESEIQAFRAAHRMVHNYRLSGDALVCFGGKGCFVYNIEKLMRTHHK